MTTTEPNATAADTRRSFIDGLRAAADLYEQNPEIPVPDTDVELSAVIPYGAESFGDAARAVEVAAVARALAPCEKDYESSLLCLRRRFGPVTVEAFTGRDGVCSRRVVGIETIEQEVVITPAVTRTETVEREIVEWDCAPILAARPAEARKEIDAEVKA